MAHASNFHWICEGFLASVQLHFDNQMSLRFCCIEEQLCKNWGEGVWSFPFEQFPESWETKERRQKALTNCGFRMKPKDCGFITLIPAEGDHNLGLLALRCQVWSTPASLLTVSVLFCTR